jgi:uncharacterized cupredoxin-like copper-binding protein
MTTRIFCRAIAPAALALAVFSAAPVALAAAGHSGGHGGQSAHGAPGQASAASRPIEVAMYDNYYEPETVSVQAGETVRFVVTNKGGLVHEFNLGTAAMHAAHQDEMQMMVEHGVLEADRINMDAARAMQASMGHGMHDEPNSVLLEPGKTAEVVWSFPADASVNLEFACNVPGHYDAGMQGEIELAR